MPLGRRRWRRRGFGVVAARKRRRLTVTAALVVVVIGGFFAVVADQIGTAERPYQTSLDETFATSLGPIARESNYTGSELSSILGGDGTALGRVSFVATLDAMVGDTENVVGQFESLTTPSNLAGPATSCLSALRSRADALGSLKATVTSLLANPNATINESSAGAAAAAETSIEQLRPGLTSADQAWSACQKGLMQAPGRKANDIPSSSWIGSLKVWSDSSVSVLVTALADSAASIAGRPLAIVAVKAEPAAVVTPSGAYVLPSTKRLSLFVVVEDVSSMAEKGVTVTVSLKETGSSGSPESSSSVASIGAGESFSFHPAALSVESGSSYVLTVSATGPGQSSAATHTYPVTVAAPNGQV